MRNIDWEKELPEVPVDIHNAVLNTLDSLDNGKRVTTKKRKIKRNMILPLVAILCVALGGTAFATVSLYNQRMEAMSRDMLEEFYASASVGSVFHYSRELSKAEQERYHSLEAEYKEQGRFPEGCVTYLVDYEDYKEKGIGLYAERSTLFLPKEELTDEELLQLIDFHSKVVYSIEKIGEEILAGDEGNYPQTIMPKADGEAVIAYKGEVGVICATEGKRGIYLAGENVIEKIPFDADNSVPFYAGDFGENMTVIDMDEDMQEGLYILCRERGEDNYEGSKLMHFDADGMLLWEKDADKMAACDVGVDAAGMVYLLGSSKVWVYSESGEQEAVIEIPYSLENGSLCRGKDGQMYTLCEDAPFRTCLLRLEPNEEEQAVLVMSDGLPTGTPHCDTLARGYETDFIIFRDDAVYAFNVGEIQCYQIMEAYEAPIPWELAEFMTLEDGRLVFIKYFDAKIGEGNNPKVYPVPDSVRIGYASYDTPGEEDIVVFEREEGYIFDTDVDSLRSITDMYYVSMEETLQDVGIVSVSNDENEVTLLSDGEQVNDIDRYILRKQGVSGISYLAELVETITWENGTTDCLPDVRFVVGNKEYAYDSGCGTFMDLSKEQHVKLSEEQKKILELIIYYCFA